VHGAFLDPPKKAGKFQISRNWTRLVIADQRGPKKSGRRGSSTGGGLESRITIAFGKVHMRNWGEGKDRRHLGRKPILPCHNVTKEGKFITISGILICRSKGALKTQATP